MVIEFRRRHIRRGGKLIVFPRLHNSDARTLIEFGRRQIEFVQGHICNGLRIVEFKR